MLSLCVSQVQRWPRRKWANVDVGHSGKFMVTPEGIIHGVKGYGVPHSRTYGTLDTLDDWDWSGYAPARRATVPA